MTEGLRQQGVPNLSAVRLRARSLHGAFTRQRIHADFTPDVQRWFLAYFRLEEAIHAAGGVCFHLSVLLAWESRACIELDRLTTARGLIVRPGEIVELSIAQELLAEADYLFHDVLWWARAFEDRVFIRAVRQHQIDGVILLLPAHLQPIVHAAASELRDWLSEARWLANYSLHGESLNRHMPIARQVADRWQVPLPDKVKATLPPYTNFNYSEGRDAITYAHGLASSIARFLEVMLDTIERADRSR